MFKAGDRVEVVIGALRISKLVKEIRYDRVYLTQCNDVFDLNTGLICGDAESKFTKIVKPEGGTIVNTQNFNNKRKVL